MRIIITAILSLFMSSLFAQSESNNLITIDTSIKCIGRNGEPAGSLFWKLRITRHVNTDTNSYPMLIDIPGDGEIATGNPSDTAFFRRYGFHYWLINGWNGSLTLGNGTHYPTLVTILSPALNIRPWYLQSCIDTIIKYYHPRGGQVSMAGLSGGSEIIGWAIKYQNSSTDHHGARIIKSWVNLEGVGSEESFPDGGDVSPVGDANFALWATSFGGRFFGLEGTNDTRKVWLASQAMNASTANTAYFAYENINGGGHCCWDQMYDPSKTNWRCIAPITNANLVNGTPVNTMGNYFVDATNGSNIFQWMLRQLDTTLIGGCTPIVSAGANQNFYLPTNSATTTGTALYQCGHAASSVLWSQVSGPNTATISAPTNLTTNFPGLFAVT